ncbi:MAG: hypothetical protein AB7I13_19450 [Vicinamibacterales bacterium]
MSRRPCDTAGRRGSTGGGARGFSFVEAALGVALVSLLLCGLMQLTSMARQSVEAARRLTAAALFADAKLQQLQALAFGYDEAGLPITDVQADTAGWPEQPTGGVGLQPSPADALRRNVAGYCDFLQPDGRSMPATVRPAGAAFLRRWSIRELPSVPAGSIAVQVRVIDLASGRADEDGGAVGVTLSTIRARWTR